MSESFSVPFGFGPEELGADGALVRLGLMGGTFDPLHVGHIAAAEAACDVCGIDRVLFIPAGNPNFKQDRSMASSVDRLLWCERVLSGFPRFGVCDIEVRREGVTYTVDTLRQLRAAYRDNVELCFIMGADSAASLARWHESSSLPALATYVVVSRPGQAIDEGLRRGLREAGFEVEYVEGLQVDVSSTDIRARLAAGESIEGLVPEVIRDGVEKEPAYRCAGFDESTDAAVDASFSLAALSSISSSSSTPASASTDLCDALSWGFFEARKHELARRVSPKRFAHIEGVVAACERLAQVYGIDIPKARLAGLLHDWDKGYGDEEIRACALDLDCDSELNPWIIDNMPQVLHAHTASRALAREYPCIPADVIRAIDRHTTAARDMTDLEMVLYVADAIEDGRQFGRIDDLRASVGRVSLEELFFLTYEYWVLLLFERRKQLHPDTIAIWNELVARRAARKGN